MKKLIILIILLHALITKIQALDAVSNVKSFLEKSSILEPFHIIKKTAEKISSVGLEKIFFGLGAGGLIYEAIKAPDSTDNEYSSFKKENRIRKINAKGQVYVNNIDENEARRRALEDALYYAAIKGGVKVDGFSSINSDTSIEEHFTVRPKSKILDYRILKSYLEQEIYIVEIEAIIGDISMKAEVCNNNKPLTIREFRGYHSINSSTPVSLDNFGKNIINLISKKLNSSENITYYDNKNNYYDFNNEKFDLSFDYKTLVNATQSISYGDYIYIPNIELTKSKIYPITYFFKNNKKPDVKNPNYFFDTEVLKVSVSVDIYNGISNNLVKKINENYLVPLNLDSNFELIKLFTKNDQEYIELEISNIAEDVTKIIKKTLICKPLTANINYLNNKLIVPLGAKNGIRKNQLAVLENLSGDANWIILSVNNLTENSATLIPLNSNVKISQLSGKKTRFLE